jgi:hypothetical protein
MHHKPPLRTLLHPIVDTSLASHLCVTPLSPERQSRAHQVLSRTARAEGPRVWHVLRMLAFMQHE